MQLIARQINMLIFDFISENIDVAKIKIVLNMKLKN